MSAPTQVLPSWLTLVSTVVTQPDGSVSTSSEILQLPLTYYGPSIPLGTDGLWTWGGLTSPPPTSSLPPTSSPSPSSSSAPTTSSVPITSFAPSSSVASSAPSTPISASSMSSSFASLSASPVTLSSSSAPSSSSVLPVSAQTSHGLSNSAIGAIVGSIVGAVLLFCLALAFYMLYRRRARDADPDSQGTSSFWNRQTSLLSRAASGRQTPIWTGWEVLDPDPDDADHEVERTPGEGSPRGSGEENDPFLTRRSVAGTGNEMNQTAADTLVSLPAAAAVAGGISNLRTEPKAGGPILSREVLLRMSEEDARPEVRVTEPSPLATPLTPPPPLGRGQRGVQSSSIRSGFSNVTAASARRSEGSLMDPHEHESAELLTARRVKLSEFGPPRPAEVPRPSAMGSATTGSTLSALDRLTSIKHTSWFKRLSAIGATAGLQTSHGAPGSSADTYTRSPPRSLPRLRSNSRPVSWAPLPTHDPSGAESSMGRQARRDSGVGLGVVADERPISTLSTRSGNTLYLDAQSTPAASQLDLASVGAGTSNTPPVPPVPPVSEHRQASAPLSPVIRRSGGYSNDPPSYNAAKTEAGPVDVLDIPAPRPSSPFTAARQDFPPGLVSLAQPRVWRDSHMDSAESSSSGVHIDVLEDEPPAAQDSWRSLAGGSGENWRTTFGSPMVVYPRDARISEQGSLHSMRSHLSPHSRFSPSGSAPASSLRTYSHSGSGSSRPTLHSQGRTTSSGASLAHSNSISSDERRPRRRANVGEVGSPPLSAVWPGREHSQESQPSSLLAPSLVPLPPLAHPSPVLPPLFRGAPVVSVYGTVTSSSTNRTSGTGETYPSVTTAMTDPITGSVIHAVRLPWRGGDTAWGEDGRRNDFEWY